MTARIVLAGTLICFIALTFATAFQKPSVAYSNQVAVLMYHHIHDTDTSSSTITTKLFREQLTLLQRKGYHFISLAQFRSFYDGGPVPDNAVLVTFDDGYESFYTNAFPVLQELRIPAVNFIITGTLAHPKEDVPPKLSGEEIRRLADSSKLIDFQCHTDSMHGKRDDGLALLLQGAEESDAEYKQRIADDMQACKIKLQQLRPGVVDAMAYPYGIYTDKVGELIRASGIRFAFTIQPGMVVRGMNPMNLPRINAGSPYITPEGLQATITRKVKAVGGRR
jgi:peptidoglycan/xylan/chitin deacetylase (PgdA/CDA1 family)